MTLLQLVRAPGDPRGISVVPNPEAHEPAGIVREMRARPLVPASAGLLAIASFAPKWGMNLRRVQVGHVSGSGRGLEPLEDDLRHLLEAGALDDAIELIRDHPGTYLSSVELSDSETSTRIAIGRRGTIQVVGRPPEELLQRLSALAGMVGAAR